MATQRNVFLVGMMASGKTTIGRQLANMLGFDFHDTDRLIEEGAGADISWIFDREGEEGFRDREELAVDEATAMTSVVVATGGGAVLRETNRQRLSTRGTVVYLSATPDLILERAGRNRNRPLLQVDDVRQRIAALCRQREPLYRAIADVVVATESLPVRTVAATVARRIAEYSARAMAAS